jgi:hypothetical protein
MTIFSRAIVAVPLLVLAACANQPPAPPAQPQSREEPAEAPRTPVPVGATAAPTGTGAVATPAPGADELKRLQKREDEEIHRLDPFQKNLFQVFRLSETLAGFKPKPNTVGVYELAASKTSKLRLSLAQLPNSPARLSVGSYMVSLDLVIDYTEKRECISGSCAGKSEEFERTANKSVQLALTPKNNFSSTAMVPMIDAKAAPGRNYRSTYSNLVLTVRRMTAAAQGAREPD